MQFAYSENEQLLIDSSAKNAAALNLHARFEEKWFTATDSFFTALTVPDKFGGSGFGALATALSLRQLGKFSNDSGFNFSVAAHLLAGTIPIVRHGSTELSERILSAVATAHFILANAMTESNSGSNAFAMKTIAKAKGDTFVLNGTKTFCTNAPVANGILVYAVTDASKGFFGGISCFLLEKAKHNYKTGPALSKTALKNSPMAEIFLNDVVVGKENMIGKIGGGAMIFHESMNWERACMAAMHTGTMERICSLTRDYVLAKESGGKRLAEHQSVQFRLAEMFLRVENSRLLSENAARIIDQGGDATLAAAKAKIYVSESFQFVAQEAIQLHGGNGIMEERLSEFLVDAQAACIYSGPNDVLRELLASQL